MEHFRCAFNVSFFSSWFSSQVQLRREWKIIPSDGDFKSKRDLKCKRKRVKETKTKSESEWKIEFQTPYEDIITIIAEA